MAVIGNVCLVHVEVFTNLRSTTVLVGLKKCRKIVCAGSQKNGVVMKGVNHREMIAYLSFVSGHYWVWIATFRPPNAGLHRAMMSTGCVSL